MSRARLIALDWGTTNLRARLLLDGAVVAGVRSSADGVMSVQDRRFEAALDALCGDWMREHRCPLLASGMIGSRQGWVETPYLPCPAGPLQAAQALVRVDAAAPLFVVPGLVCTGRDGQPDVMRGEETQIWGAALDAGACAVLPGTHSKWAWTGAAGVVQTFRTYMTGELYGLLTQHGILGRLMQPGAPAPGAFADGARLGLSEHAQATHVIFAARSGALLGRVAPAAVGDFLSGMLIGIEVGAALACDRPHEVMLLGDATLCERYAVALAIAGVPVRRDDGDATMRGQWLVAQQAGLPGLARSPGMTLEAGGNRGS